MKVSKTWSCPLFLSAVLNLSGCTQISRTPTLMPVPVNTSCDVTDITEHTGKPVTLTFPGAGYRISFNPKYDKTSKKEITPLPSSISYPATTPPTATWANAGTPTDCGDHLGGCYFKYNIYSAGSLCADPGIQIIP
jgi:hypothetical protein